MVPMLATVDAVPVADASLSERAARKSLRARGCNVIMAAHRLSAFRDCDTIVVLQHGKEIERGRHAELWRAGGAYRQLIGESE